MITTFLISDGWRFIASDGSYINITKDELENYRLNQITDDEIKALCYGYITGKSFLNFSTEGIEQSYEF